MTTKKDLRKLIKVTDKGVSIIDDELMESLKKKNLSPSMVSSFFNCPADWLIDSFVLREIEHEEAPHFERGHIFHETMEKFLALPPESRTNKQLSMCATETIKKNYAHVLTNTETLAWVKNALQGYLKLDLNPMDDKVSMIVKNKEKNPDLIEQGIELFVMGKLGNVKRNIVGYVDLVLDGENGHVIRDWKTGKKIHPFDPAKPISDSNDFGYWRQQLTYTMLMEKMGFKVEDAELIFPIAGGVVKIDVNNQSLRERVIKDYEMTEELLDKCIEDNLFPFKGHHFCTWCGTLHPSFRAPRQKPKVNKSELVQVIDFLNYE